MRQIILALTLLFTGLIVSSCASLTDGSIASSTVVKKEVLDGNQIRALKSRYDRFASVCIGNYNNFEQVAELKLNGAGAKLPPAATMRQRISTRRVWNDRTDAIWLYSEMYLVDLAEEPVLQKFMAIRRISPDTIEMETFDIPLPSRFINEWRKAPANRFTNLRVSDLIPIEGCLNYFTEQEKGVFQSTEPTVWCEQKVGSSEGFKENIRYTPERMILRTHGRDAKGNTLWKEFKENPLVFAREVEEPKQVVGNSYSAK